MPAHGEEFDLRRVREAGDAAGEDGDRALELLRLMFDLPNLRGSNFTTAMAGMRTPRERISHDARRRRRLLRLRPRARYFYSRDRPTFNSYEDSG